MPTRSTPNPSGAEPVNIAELDAVLAALAHPARRQIVLVLAARGASMTAGQIADRFKHAWPTTTRHLGVLEAAGIIRVERHGRERHYTLSTDPIRRVAGWMLDTADLAAAPADTSSWKDLPYATMRNTKPPQRGRKPKRR